MHVLRMGHANVRFRLHLIACNIDFIYHLHLVPGYAASFNRNQHTPNDSLLYDTYPPVNVWVHQA